MWVVAARLAVSLDHDLVVLGGDYQTWGLPAGAEAGRLLAPLLESLHPVDGMIGILGNHDSVEMVAPLEALGVRLLINESLTLTRGDQCLHLIGCDDIHTFHDPAADAALRQGEGFRIALIHSPGFAPQAAAAGCSLYLAGHTHGGQVCLPGGRPIITALDRDHHLARGIWRQGEMRGYTSTGLGASQPGVRYNCPPEIALITLRRDVAAPSLT